MYNVEFSLNYKQWFKYNETLRVRGLLCNNCNVAIGFLGDSIKKARKSIEYLSHS